MKILSILSLEICSYRATLAVNKSDILRSPSDFGNDVLYYERETRSVKKLFVESHIRERDFPSRFVILANINTWRGLERSSLLAKDQRWSYVKSVRFIAMINGDSLFATINAMMRIWCASFSSLHVHQLFANVKAARRTGSASIYFRSVAWWLVNNVGKFLV